MIMQAFMIDKRTREFTERNCI